MKYLHPSSAVAAALIVSMFLSGCDRNEGPSLIVGKYCKIQFRRDALGAAASVPVPPTTDSFNGANTAIGGNVKRTTGEWVVLESSGSNGEIWIPKSVILLIEQ